MDILEILRFAVPDFVRFIQNDSIPLDVVQGSCRVGFRTFRAE
jgi:hypothetical protein